MINQAINTLVDWIVIVASDLLMPMMVFAWGMAFLVRGLIYFTISREAWFAEELEKRANAMLEQPELPGHGSFFVALKRVLEKNYYEIFIVRSVMKRRRPDSVAMLSDRLFLIQHGCARMVQSTLKHARFLRYEPQQPRLLDISKAVFENNRCFNRLFGVIPTGMLNDVLNLMPGLFIVGGIFGTFLGIMQGLPQLGGMDLADAEGSKKIMDAFLVKSAYAMGTSILGIVCSVTLQIFNTTFSPEKLFVTAVNRFESVLSAFWVRSSNNDVPKDLREFDENKDSLEALAEQAVEKELARNISAIRNAS